MKLENIMLGERGPSQKDILYDSTYMSYLEKSNSQKKKLERWMPGAGETGNGKLLFNEYKVSVIQDEKCSGHQLHNNVNVLNISELKLKDGEDGKSYDGCILSQLRNFKGQLHEGNTTVIKLYAPILQRFI